MIDHYGNFVATFILVVLFAIWFAPLLAAWKQCFVRNRRIRQLARHQGLVRKGTKPKYRPKHRKSTPNPRGPVYLSFTKER